MKSFLLLFSLIGVSHHCFAEILITHSLNRPDFIEVQYKTFKKFLKNDYRFVIFNDAKDLKTSNEIVHICKENDIQCIRIPQEVHKNNSQPSVRTANVIHYSLDTLGYAHNDIVVIIDSDMFLIKEFDIRLDSHFLHYRAGGN